MLDFGGQEVQRREQPHSLSLKGPVQKKSGYRAWGQGMRWRSLLKGAEERTSRNKEGSAARARRFD